MNKSMNTRLAIALVAANCAANGDCKPLSGEGRALTEEGSLAGADKLDVTLCTRTDGLSSRVFLVFFNGSKSTLWFPMQSDPAYKPDKDALKIWFGYSDEVHGMLMGQYMLPEMHAVRPGKGFKFELTSPLLVQSVLDASMGTTIQVRVATKAFVYSRVRSSQPFQDYIDNSIVFESEAEKTKKAGARVDFPDCP